MNPESLIFDVDGTLWDSVDLVVRGWNLALEEAGREPTCTPEGIRPLFGKTMDEIALAFLPDQGPEERRRLMNSCMAWEDRVMQDDPCEIFYPQVRQTLEALSRRHRLFIVSNCQKGYIELLLEKGKLGGLIRDHACFGETGLCGTKNLSSLSREHGTSCYRSGACFDFACRCLSASALARSSTVCQMSSI